MNETAMDTRLDVILRNDLSELERLAGLVEGFVERNRLPTGLSFSLNLCLDELLTNTMSHGYPDDAPHEIRVGLVLEPDCLHVRVEDDGIAFDPFTEAPPPDLDSDLDDRPVGGLGVFLVKETMDETHYRREGGCNIITLVKHLSNTEGI